MDGFGRVIDYLRISVTDRCNERCLYCMPEGYKGWAQRADHLSAEEIVRVAGAAVAVGFRKIRLTGGEPTIRKDLVDIARGIGRLDSLEALALSTNGTRLEMLSAPLRDAGVSTVNISLDALNAEIYRHITGADIEPVLRGIQAAQGAGFSRVKLNSVLLRGKNEKEIWPLVLFAAERGLPIRFIELMPLTQSDVLSPDNFLSSTEVLEMLAQRDVVEPLEGGDWGFGPARYFRLRRSGAIVGVIGAITNQHFCETCNKIRLTADGKLRPCLGRHNEIDLVGALRNGDATLEDVLNAAVAAKPENHEFSECYEPGRPMTAIGG